MPRHDRPATPSELEELHNPDVENRLHTIEGTLSLFTILTRAISQSEDLCLTSESTQPGWSMLSDLAAEALGAAQTIQYALPYAALSTKAPTKEAA